MPRPNHRSYGNGSKFIKLLEPIEQSAIYRRGTQLEFMSLAEVREKYADGFAVKMGSIKVNTQHGVQSLPLYQPTDRGGSTSNISSRMSPPVPTVKSLLKTGLRRHKVKSYRQTRNSPYIRLVQSNLGVIGTHTHKENQTFCALCIIQEWGRGNRHANEISRAR